MEQRKAAVFCHRFLDDGFNENNENYTNLRHTMASKKAREFKKWNFSLLVNLFHKFFIKINFLCMRFLKNPHRLK